jgi:hypothetical protein
MQAYCKRISLSLAAKLRGIRVITAMSNATTYLEMEKISEK